ncbi:MAG: hypothetical protein HY552_04720 [Elusimicrobia bacterium]|nr:hypothetical protein [Elusimicrobiota bacterium]
MVHDEYAAPRDLLKVRRQERIHVRERVLDELQLALGRDAVDVRSVPAVQFTFDLEAGGPGRRRGGSGEKDGEGGGAEWFHRTLDLGVGFEDAGRRPFAGGRIIAYSEFQDRRDGGRALAEALGSYRGRPDAVVLAVPRGGAVVGAVLAEALGLPLDVVLVKKLGHPAGPERAIGVVGLTGELIDEAVVEREGIARAYVASQVAGIRARLRRRGRLYRGRRPPLDLRGRTVLLCDDGIATGHTMAAAVRLARGAGARRVVAAAPVGSREGVAALRALADETVCLLEPEDFFAVGRFYRDFASVEDAEVVRILKGM